MRNRKRNRFEPKIPAIRGVGAERAETGFYRETLQISLRHCAGSCILM